MDARRKKIFYKTWAISAGLAALVMLCLLAAGKAGPLRLVSFALGLGTAALALWCFARAWQSAPDTAQVVTWYILRLICEFVPVLVAMFVPFLDALGILIPQLFPIFVLAVLLVLQKD